jgi:hypothetical protein
VHSDAFTRGVAMGCSGAPCVIGGRDRAGRQEAPSSSYRMVVCCGGSRLHSDTVATRRPCELCAREEGKGMQKGRRVACGGSQSKAKQSSVGFSAPRAGPAAHDSAKARAVKDISPSNANVVTKRFPC